MLSSRLSPFDGCQIHKKEQVYVIVDLLFFMDLENNLAIA